MDDLLIVNTRDFIVVDKTIISKRRIKVIDLQPSNILFLLEDGTERRINASYANLLVIYNKLIDILD